MSLILRGYRSPYLITRGLHSSDEVIRNIDWRFGCPRLKWAFGCTASKWSFGEPTL